MKVGRHCLQIANLIDEKAISGFSVEHNLHNIYYVIVLVKNTNNAQLK